MAVKHVAWDDAKNAKFRADRGIGFEDIVFHIERCDLLDILEHPNAERYAGRRIFVVRREDYVDLVPFVEDEHTVLPPSAQSPRAGDPAVLKTIIPSRKATKPYLGVPQEASHRGRQFSGSSPRREACERASCGHGLP